LHSGGQAYVIPFPEGTSASKGNVIELSVVNNSALTAEQVKVEITNAPAWLKFSARGGCAFGAEQKDTIFQQLKPKEEQVASFSFSVEKTAELNKEQTLSFTITDKSGQVWTKEIKIRVTPPMNFELFQNYPNPFNPTTMIEYQLPGAGIRYTVSLRIYDVLGREVADLVNEQQESGFYQKTFDAHQYASGMYVYRLIATDEQNNKHVFKKKMILLR
jgi:hypothetical protein